MNSPLIIILNKILGLRPVQYLLLLAVIGLTVTVLVVHADLKLLNTQLDVVKSRNSECVATAKANKIRTAELQQRVADSADEIARISKQYDARIDKLKNTRLTSDTCAGMIAESVKLMQEGDYAR